MPLFPTSAIPSAVPSSLQGDGDEDGLDVSDEDEDEAPLDGGRTPIKLKIIKQMAAAVIASDHALRAEDNWAFGLDAMLTRSTRPLIEMVPESVWSRAVELANAEKAKKERAHRKSRPAEEQARHRDVGYPSERGARVERGCGARDDHPDHPDQRGLELHVQQLHVLKTINRALELSSGALGTSRSQLDAADAGASAGASAAPRRSRAAQADDFTADLRMMNALLDPTKRVPEDRLTADWRDVLKLYQPDPAQWGAWEQMGAYAVTAHVARAVLGDD
jgi:hypothetical protein